MSEDILIIQLRDCFTAGYTLPQFCVDNNIKKPLFIAIGKRRADLLWEIYVQFKYDRRITPKFTFANAKDCAINFSVESLLNTLILEDYDKINFSDYDSVIVLSTERINVNLSNIIYIEQLTNYFISRAYVDIPILHFLQRHPKVKLIVTNFPEQPKIDDEDFLKNFYNIVELIEKFLDNRGVHVPNHFDKLGYTNDEVAILMHMPDLNTNLDGSTYMEDDPNPLVGIKNNQRMTADQPENYVNKIYFVGTCHQYGINAPFDKTIPSYLQKMLNENNLPYRVENVSQRYHYRYQEIFYNLAKLAPKPNDIIFIHADGIKPRSLPFFDLSNAFDGYDYKKIWVIKFHVNEIGYKILAEKYFRLLVQNNFFKNANFKYSTPPLARIVTVFRMKILLLQLNFLTWRSWTLTNKNFVKNVSKLVA